ncbi:DUF4870 domain-containing protein [candidate division KSB1 bacterium]|nr:DUF4870 domain-containing protein [candidate division KSB1 bacterium]NIR69766.1 DUF4870 domain-containing protein [candidate division KSB1 bacterium]NIS22949.1 DUF4870 domain-containing protein [candidate division KSB1 bacterium]NIT69806.1 DUF4870 domain-containing protein [candidate division KSB1 bacterium]NIU23480.1 DUF4870 domain-containing protein [candidate division KSB1 bacterium]
MWAVFCHLGGLFGAMIPPGNIILPLVIWLSQREKYPFVDDQGKEAINFQISLSIYFIASAILIIIGIGLLLILGLAVFALIVTIMAALKASAGSKYRYPLTMRFLA